MNPDALSWSMFWVGALFVFTPMLFAGIILGVWWHGRKQQATRGPETLTTPPGDPKPGQ